MSRFNDLRNLDYLSSKDEVKFIIGDREDFDYSIQIIALLKEMSLLKRPIHWPRFSEN
jgi:hypothetical protein